MANEKGVKLRLKEDKKAFFYPEDYEKMESLVDNEKQLFTLKGLLHTGARINEFAHIDETDIDHIRRNLTLRVTKVRAKLQEKRPTPRTIPLSTGYYKYLKKNIGEFKIHSRFAANIFIKKLAKKAELPYWRDLSPHNLRKTYGTWLIALDVDSMKIAQNLGHSVDMLQTHYAKGDIFNADDKIRMEHILGDLPKRLGGGRYR